MGGTKPWPEVPVGNEDQTSAAVVIIGAGMGGAYSELPNEQYQDIDSADSYSFEQNPSWTREYPGQEEMLDYLISVAQKWNLYKYVRFNTEVKSATWNDTTQQWNLDVSVVGGKAMEYGDKYTISSDFLTCAIGQLNRPSYPKIDGLDSFEGKMMHSARWDWTYDLRDKRVGIIGAGATSIQIIPEIVDRVKHLTIYHRSPHWVTTRNDQNVPKWRRNLFYYFPYIQSRIRAGMHDLREGYHEVWRDNENSDYAEEFTQDCLTKMQKSFPSDSEHDVWMREQLTPRYQVGCKRICVSDDYYPALAKPHVTLEPRPIKSISPTGPVIDTSSKPNPTAVPDSDNLDVLVLATGFQTMSFLAPIDFTGRNGRKLGDIWANGPHSLNGVTVQDLPNFGMMYGPNTNLGHSSIGLMLEAQSRYIAGLAGAVLDGRKEPRNRGAGAKPKAMGKDPATEPAMLTLYPKPEAISRYNTEMQARLAQTPFADPNCSSWYKDPATGKITNNWPGDCREFGTRLSKVEWDDYEGGDQVKRMRKGQKQADVGRVKEDIVVSDGMLMLMGAVSAVAGVAGWYLRKGRGFGGLLG
ncbi:MAG: hypothetical protein Q9159_002525 [Coniocarpon cinnabarinum]